MIRNHEAQVIGTLRAARTLNCNPFVAESIALLMVFQLYRDIGLHSIQLEGDALQVVRLLKHNLSDWSESGLLIQDAYQLLNSFAHWSVHHVNWDYSFAAHCLAKDALRCIADVIELEEIPLCIVNVLQKDAASWQAL